MTINFANHIDDWTTINNRLNSMIFQVKYKYNIIISDLEILLTFSLDNSSSGPRKRCPA